MSSFILHGNIIHSRDVSALCITENGYAVCVDGLCRGVFATVPEEYKSLPIIDYADKLIIPGLVDLHIHGAQYAYRGMGMDLELLDWLDTYAFPEEAKFADENYARAAYSIFTDAMKMSATTRACIFASAQSRATEILMELLEETGLITYVGKVNMDRDAPDNLREESAASAAEDTERWAVSTLARFRRTKPMITPRFVPSCTNELMAKLGEIRKKYDLAVQSHISESVGEIELVHALRPDDKFYGEAYDKCGLFGDGVHSHTVMAHCVWSSEAELELMQKNGVFIAHCPASNMNVASGIAPVRRYIERGMKMGLGSDVAGGQTESMFRAMTDAVQSSKLYFRHVDMGAKPLGLEEAFYLATRGGGEFFGKVGAFEDGYEFDAVVIDDISIPHPQPLNVRQRIERAVYLGADAFGIVGKFVFGEKII